MTSDSIPATIGPGTQIAEYQLEEEIGKGGMGVVFKARDVKLGRPVAVKVMSPGRVDREEHRARFLREPVAAARIRSRHITQVYRAGESGGVLYIATEFVPGGDLAAALAREGGTWPPERAAELVRQVASALDAAHAAGIVHRDVKPPNILLDMFPGKPDHAYLTDFGLSRDVSASNSLTEDGLFLGTVAYCAPEQARSSAVDGRADQYSLACVAFELLTGAVPFRRTTPAATMVAHANDPVPPVGVIRRELPVGLDEVFARGLAKSPADRYASCGEFAAALRSAFLEDARTMPPREADDRNVVTDPGNGPFVKPAPGKPANAAPARHRAPAKRLGARARRRWLVLVAGTALTIFAAALTGYMLSEPGQDHSPGNSHPTAGNLNGGQKNTAPPMRTQVSSGLHLAARMTIPGAGGVDKVQVSADGKYIAASDWSTAGANSIYVWNTAGKLVAMLRAPAAAHNFWLDPNNDTTFSAVVQSNYHPAVNGIYTWKIPTGAAAPATVPYSGFKRLPADPYSWVVDTADNAYAVENAAGNEIQIFKLGTKAPAATLPMPGTHKIAKNGLGFANERFIAADTSGTIYVWDISTWRVIDHLDYLLDNPTSGIVPQITLSPDGKTVLLREDGAVLRNVDTALFESPADPRWPHGNARFIFGSDGTQVATQSPGSTTVNLWDVATRGHVGAVTSLPRDGAAVGPDGTEVVTFAQASRGGARQLLLYRLR